MNKEMIIKKVKNALEIRQYIQDILKKYNVETEFNKDSVNPFYNQTEENYEGFICEYYYGYPSKIYTPLGELSIISGYLVNNENGKNAIKEIETSLGLVLIKEPILDKIWGQFGGWYYITRLPWDNIELECNQAKELYNSVNNN